MLKARARLLQKYLCDEQKELQALYALQALVVTLEQPPSKPGCRRVGGGVRVGGLAGERGGQGRRSVQELWAVIREQNTLMVCFLPPVFSCLQVEVVSARREG